jgi:hypothetical protein
VKRSGQVTLLIQVLLASIALSQFWNCLPSTPSAHSARHVVEHQRGRQRFEKRRHLVEIGVLEIDHDVPAEIGDALGDPLHHVLRRRDRPAA